MDELDFKGGLVGDFKRSSPPSSLLLKPPGTPLDGDEEDGVVDQRQLICKSPSNSSFGFENTFRVLQNQVSRDDEHRNTSDNSNPAIVTTLELELGAAARLQQFSQNYSTPKSEVRATTVRRRINSPTQPELVVDSDKYLEFLNQFIRKSRQKKGDTSDDYCDKTQSEAVDEVEGEPGLVEFGEYPELVYCITKDVKSGRYRLQNKDRRKKHEGKQNV